MKKHWPAALMHVSVAITSWSKECQTCKMLANRMCFGTGCSSIKSQPSLALVHFAASLLFSTSGPDELVIFLRTFQNAVPGVPDIESYQVEGANSSIKIVHFSSTLMS